MSDLLHRDLHVNGIRMHVAERGEGPLVLLCHGFPECWSAWRHQLTALAAAGYRAVAPDMRGYGRTDAPDELDRYTILHLVGDMVALVDALGGGPAVIAGHDWGATVAWHAALLRPDRFRGVIGCSVPYWPRGQARPTSVMPRAGSDVFYQLYFQPPGVAEAELERDVPRTMRRLLHAASGEAAITDLAALTMVPERGGFISRLSDPAAPPAWLPEEDLAVVTAEFQASGFRGALNWYRNIDRNWELLAPFAGMRIVVPALYIVGSRDLVLAFPRIEQLLANLPAVVPHLRERITLDGCGHWTMEERPAEVNAAMLGFLDALP